MKRNTLFLFLFLSVCLFMSGCHSSDSNKSSEDRSTESATDMGMYSESESFAENDMAENIDNQKDTSSNTLADIDDDSDENGIQQMIIRNARLDIKVNDLEKTQLHLEKKVSEYEGYVVESNMYRESDEHMSAYMSIRIPEKHFQRFLTDTEENAINVLERIVTGKDVTEDYVDLTSKLTSKRVVEERLLAFLKDAEKTDDLLKISTDLADVQENIEVVVGKMNYLENQASYATVDISMFEDSIIVPDIDNKDLNTWENTKKQLATSFNFLLAAGSGFIVFFIGNLPIIILLLVIGAIVYRVIRGKVKRD